MHHRAEGASEICEILINIQGRNAPKRAKILGFLRSVQRAKTPKNDRSRPKILSFLVHPLLFSSDFEHKGGSDLDRTPLITLKNFAASRRNLLTN